MPTVLLIGTLDTKGDELAFVAGRLRDAGVDVLVADAGTEHAVDPALVIELPRERGGGVRHRPDRRAAVRERL